MAPRNLSMAYAGTSPWAKSGVEIAAGMSPKDMLKAAGLNWAVEKRPLFVQEPKRGENIEVPGKYGLVRTTDNEVLTLVGTGYKPLQNEDAVDFFTKFVKAGDMEMKAMGSVKEGRYIWALAKVGESYNVGPAKAQDGMTNYILLSSPHVAGLSMRAQFLPTRESCWNTIALALSSGGRQGELAGRAFRMPHSQVFSDILKLKAEEALGIATKQGDKIKEMATALAKTRIDKLEMQELSYRLLRVSADKVKEIIAGNAKQPLIMAKMEDALEKAPGANLASAKGTLWGWLNAATYVVDHEQGRSADNRLFSAWFGEGAAIKQRALALALEKAE